MASNNDSLEKVQRAIATLGISSLTDIWGNRPLPFEIQVPESFVYRVHDIERMRPELKGSLPLFERWGDLAYLFLRETSLFVECRFSDEIFIEQIGGSFNQVVAWVLADQAGSLAEKNELIETMDFFAFPFRNEFFAWGFFWDFDG